MILSYLYGMSAFGWIETNFYDEAEKCALKVTKQSLHLRINFSHFFY